MNNHIHDSLVGLEDVSRSAGAPVEKIEITPEMIAAGVTRLFDYDPNFSNEKDIVAEIFMAMLNTR